MKKLLITNLVTAVIVLGIIAAYSFKPEQKAGAKYATVVVTFYDNANGYDYEMVVTSEGKSQTIATKKMTGKSKHSDLISTMSIETNQQLESLEALGYQLVSSETANTSSNNQIEHFYNLRKP